MVPHPCQCPAPRDGKFTYYFVSFHLTQIFPGRTLNNYKRQACFSYDVPVQTTIRGELKAKSQHFFFGNQPNISKVKFVELLLLVSCFLQQNYVRSWAFPTFLAISGRAQKLSQEPTLRYMYDMGNRDFVINRNTW